MEEDLSRNFELGTQTDLLLLDFSKTFDNVSHLRYLHKLKMHGVQGTTLVWNSSFLISRTQSLVLSGDCSVELSVTSGVPQCSVLGPILFHLYINDLSDDVQSQDRLFADDTAVFLALERQNGPQQLQENLNQLFLPTFSEVETVVGHGV